MNVDTLVNLTAEPTGKLYSWLPHDLKAERVVFLPDACPGKAPLPTGTAVQTRQPDWRKFAISDCGCGMRLLRAELAADELSIQDWNDLAELLKENKGGLGDLGGGNHFIDALMPRLKDNYSENGLSGDRHFGDRRLHLLIHTGSRHESGHVDDLVERPQTFDREFDRVVSWAETNRASVQKLAEKVLGPLELVLDLPHNTYEKLETGGAIIRKGSAHVAPGDLNIIPSHITDDVALVRATSQVEQTLYSLSHGTGRAMPTSEAKQLAREYDFDALRSQLLIPDAVSDASLRGEGPYAYRDLEGCLHQISDYAEVVQRFKVIGYMGHL